MGRYCHCNSSCIYVVVFISLSALFILGLGWFILIIFLLLILYEIFRPSRKKIKPKGEPTSTQTQKEPAMEEVTVVDKVTIPTIAMQQPKDYSAELPAITAFFGKLYKYLYKDTLWGGFNTLRVSVPVGVYYGYTKYTGETNRNGIKAVALMLPDNNTQLILLGRELWKRYDKVFGEDGLKWLGYSDGESVRVSIYRGKVPKQRIEWYLTIVGQWIASTEYNNTIYKMAKTLNLPQGEFTYNKVDSGYGYNYYYNGKYIIAGLNRYVAAPFVSFGFAVKEPSNNFNPRAVAIYTDKGIKVGYISEKELLRYRLEANGEEKLPIVMEGHYYKGKLYGWLYTFSNNECEYPYMSNQYIKLVKSMQ